MSPRRTSPERDAARLARRDGLLDAAVRVIRRDGPGPSMDAIAAEAGITKPILYRHFGDRAGMVAALADRFADELNTVLSGALATDGDPRAVLEGTIDAYLAFVERDRELYRFLVQQTGRGGAETQFMVGDFMRQVGDQIALVLGERLREAGRDSGGAEPIAHGLVGMVHAAGDWWVERRTMPRHRLVQYLVEVLWDGLGELAPDAPLAVVTELREGNVQ
jgi:AcrR family transcriptional regulator